MGKTPISLADAAFDNKKDLVRKLLASGADVHEKNSSGRTALHSASIANDLEIVELLLAAGAKADVPDKSGHVPLHFAAQHAVRVPVLEKLLEVAPTTVNHQNVIGHTPLFVAVDHKCVDAVTRLMSHGADPTKQDCNGKSIIDWAPNAKIRALLLGNASAAASTARKAKVSKASKAIQTTSANTFSPPPGFKRLGKADDFMHEATKLPFVLVPGGALRKGPSDRDQLEAVGLDADAIAEFARAKQQEIAIGSLLVAKHPLLDKQKRPRQLTKSQATIEVGRLTAGLRVATALEWEWLARSCGKTILIGVEDQDAAEEACASLSEDDKYTAKSVATSPLGIWGLLVGEWVMDAGELAGISGAAGGYPFQDGDVVGACLACVGPRPAREEKLAFRIVYPLESDR